jgi:hypothetical protein
VASPYGSVQQLVNSLAPGDVGCLRSGATFNEAVSVLNRPGTADQPFIVQSADPANPATIAAASDPATGAVLYFGSSASHFEFLGVNIHALSGTGTPAVTIAGTGNSVEGADITNAGNGTCVQIGPSSERRAVDARLDGDAVHSCGDTSPAHNTADGAIIGYADGTQITNSYFYRSPRHGITMFPDAQRTAVSHNVIDRQSDGMGDGEGVQFGGDNLTSSSNNLVEANLITDSEKVNIGYNWNGGSGTPGTGNDVRGNCVSNSVNTNGEFETDVTTHQTVGYSQEQNTIGADPEYEDRNGSPPDYSLASTSPCLRLGPLATATTDAAFLSAPDPEARHVFTATLWGDINPHFQSVPFHFDVGPENGPRAQIFGGYASGFSVPGDVFVDVATRLKPKTKYSYRLVPENPVGSAPGQTLSFTTAAAPKLAPPIPTIAYNTLFKKKGVELSELAVKHVPAALVELECKPRSDCPFKQRSGTGNLPLLRNRPYRPGTTITIRVGTPHLVGRYYGRATRLRIGRADPRHPAQAVKRTETCLAAKFRDTPCLRAVAQFLSFPAWLQFTRFVALRVPRGATLDYRCVHGRCPHFPSCRSVAAGFRDIRLLSRAASRKVKPGAVFDVRVLKPDTSGLVNRFTIQKRGGKVVAERRSFFVPTGVQHSGRCPDA